MRKSHPRKLHLNRESLRILSEEDLGAVRGGTGRTTFPSVCNAPTFNCGSVFQHVPDRLKTTCDSIITQ